MFQNHNLNKIVINPTIINIKNKNYYFKIKRIKLH